MAHPVDAHIHVTARYKQISTVGNWKTCGHHTGVDFACQTGDPVYAVVAGHVRHRAYGPAFGLTVAVSPDGPGEWQYSHLSWARPDGTWVEAGDLVGRAGTSGGVAPHLHLEWHPVHKNVWRCGIQADPLTEIRRLARESWRFGAGHKVYLSKLRFGGHETNPDKVSDSIMAAQQMLNRHSLKPPGNVTIPEREADGFGKYGPMTDTVVRACQEQCGPSKFGQTRPDPEGESSIGPKQWAHLVEVTGAPFEAVDDRPKGGGDWWLSQAGHQLFTEVNAMWPGRDRRTDGTVGDASHTTGEHVPDPGSSPPGVVRAVDIDADLDGEPGTSWQLAEVLRRIGKGGDARLWYVIHDGRIVSGTHKDSWWEWRPYTGSNPHTSHLHVSFHPVGDRDPAGFGVAGVWDDMYPPKPPKPPDPPDPPDPPGPPKPPSKVDVLAARVTTVESVLAQTEKQLQKVAAAERATAEAVEVGLVRVGSDLTALTGTVASTSMELRRALDDLTARVTALETPPGPPDPPDPPGREPGVVRAGTFNIPPRYRKGGEAADLALLEEVLAQCDVIGMQEAGWVTPLLTRLGWEVHHPVDSKGEHTSNLLAWNPGVFGAVSAGTTLLSPDTRVQPEAAGPTVHRESHIVWADLTHRATDVVWYLGCVHMMPSKHLGGAAGSLWIRQRDTALAWMGRQGDPCVLVGDFNATKNDVDALPVLRAAAVRTAPSHGRRRIDWVVVRDAPGVSSTPGKALPHRGQSDHKPVTCTVRYAP